MSVRSCILIFLLVMPALHAAEDEPKPWSLELPLGFPEGLGAVANYHSSPYFSLNLFYHWSTPLRIKTQVKSRKLVDRDGFLIRSPTLDLPFHVDLGPHRGMGASYRPFGSAFYLMLAFEWREVTIKSAVQSHLEILDSQNRMMTNTLFQATAETHTAQSLLRPSVGYRWDIGETHCFFSLYSGWSRPLVARSTVRTEVRVRNPEASHPAEVDARNLEEAENEQARIMEQKLVQELKKFEKQSLPVFGISLGKFL
ncbi:MAG TPA: hypothetical protein VFO10_00045 [Oligoflexus sp.]|uniref:hypothetical protein n=1 Tax=Oligoflexus sp. TaxID=1971216 RepID=UPI002D7F0C1A|nr:hypothetical protein [Oligoflexus sp.]HET9235604.1 hypothetical protein [Oligoflexus sp.]